MSNSILIVDDERGIRETLRGVLEDEGFDVETVGSGEACLKTVAENNFSCILLDVWLPEIDGLETLKQLRETGNDAAVVMISGHGNIETAVAAIQHGAYDFIEKPFQTDRLLLICRRAIEAARLSQENAELRLRAGTEAELTGDSAAIAAIRGAVEKVAPTGSRVLITGPAGSGKEVVARMA